MSLLLKVPDNYDVNKIGFILLQDEFDDESSMEIDYDLTPNMEKTNDGNKIKCHICEKTFSNRSNLRRHLNNLHLTKNNFKCNLCDRSFEKQAQLSGHFRVHGRSKIKPWLTCDNCGKTERSMTAMRQHVETHQIIFKIDINDIFM